MKNREPRREPPRDGLSRRELLRKALLGLVALPVLKLSETVARAERRRRRYEKHHRGHSDEMWIGHC